MNFRGFIERLIERLHKKYPSIKGGITIEVFKAIRDEWNEESPCPHCGKLFSERR